ncbi:MAG: T9SS type A sorting domain-containing protein [Bacteroidota bacterium]|nr:T9SS type A sorting domain-containing protein [Bacteroidota bacterium]
MKKIKLALFLLVILVSTKAVKASAAPMADLVGFSMVWGFTNSSGSIGEWAWNDVCMGGVVYVKNKSIYGINNGNAWPIPNTLTGTYKVYNAVGNSNGILIASIPAANWPYNGVYAVQLPAPGALGASFNYSQGLNIRIYYVGSDVATGIRQRSNYLYTRPLPNVNAGADQSVCQGGSVQLTGSGASTYSWNPGGGTQSSVVVTPTANSTYTLTGSVVYNTASTSMTQTLTCTKSDNVNITILPNPKVKGWTNHYSLCTGAVFPNLNAYAGTGSFSYQWSYAPVNGMYTVLPVTTSNLNTSAYGFGSYHVLVTDNFTGCITSLTANVVSDPSAAANMDAGFVTSDIANTSAGTLTISPSSSVSGNHVWYLYNSDANFNQGTLIATYITSSFTTTLALEGYYLLKHNISKSPCNEVKSLTIGIHYDIVQRMLQKEIRGNEEVSPAKLGTFDMGSRENLVVFPNPNKGIFTVQLNEFNNSNNMFMEVYDMTGRLVKKQNATSVTETIDLQGQSDGTYTLRIVNGNEVNVQKVIILGNY